MPTPIGVEITVLTPFFPEIVSIGLRYQFRQVRMKLAVIPGIENRRGEGRTGSLSHLSHDQQ